jgi:hypothetical protein
LNTNDILAAAGVTVVPCLLFDFGLFAFQKWQRQRAEVVDAVTLGPISRTVVSLVMNGCVGGVIAYLYGLIGTEIQDAYLIGASLWLIISVPVLLTTRFMDDGQKQVMASRVLGWLVKTIIASTSAALMIAKGV